MNFCVYDNSKPASGEGFPYLKRVEWACHSYKSFPEALTYTKEWLGHLSIVLPDDWQGQPLDYSGYGDMIEIRQEP